MRVLFVKPSLVYPRTSGHDVYCYFMMKGIAAEGAEVALLTAEPTDPKAVEGIKLLFCGQLDSVEPAQPRQLSYLQERFRSFWGVSQAQLESVRRTTERLKADVVVAFGLPALPYLAGVDGAVRVWAMADEWVYHHLTQTHLTDRSSWHHLKSAAIKGAYERAYRKMVDRFWAVSDTDLRAGRWFAGMKAGDLLPNGVDTEFFQPVPVKEIPRTAVFWGRLDFEPNIDALLWFCRDVWPGIRARVPDARFTIIGYSPTPEVKALASVEGVELRANVEDLRRDVCEHALVVLPMVSGGGIKNKLLEGAAMGRPIICTPRAALDLRPPGRLPLEIVKSPQEWVDGVAALWQNEQRRRELGTAARAWVQEYYSWAVPARNALAAFAESRARLKK